MNPNSSAMQCGLASWGLSFIGAEAPKALREAAQSENPAIKTAAIAALGEQIQSLGDEDARNIVIKALDDPAFEVRAEATTLIGKLNDPNWAKSLLIKKLTDSNDDVRKNAALSLMKLKATETIDTLQQVSLLEKDTKVTNVFKLVINQLKELLI